MKDITNRGFPNMHEIKNGQPHKYGNHRRVGIEKTVGEARKLIKIEIIKLSKCQTGSVFNSHKYHKDCFTSELKEFNNNPLIPIGWLIQMQGFH